MSKQADKRMRAVLSAFSKHHDLHRGRIMHLFGIDAFGTAADQKLQKSLAKAKDIGATVGLRITPVVERSGWWTSRPTDAVALMAEGRRISAMGTEWRRNARVFKGMPMAGTLGIAVRNQLEASVQTLSELMPTASRVDECLQRIDQKVAAHS